MRSFPHGRLPLREPIGARTHALGHPQLKKILPSPRAFFQAILGRRYIKSSLIDVAFPEKQLYKCMLLGEAMLTSSPPQADFF